MSLIPCPDCAREVSSTAPDCVHCGRPMNAPSPVQRPACPLCHTPVTHANARQGGVVFCERCGARLAYRANGFLTSVAPRGQVTPFDPAPAAPPATRVVVVGPQKSVGLAVLLAFFFGPLGMLYSTVAGAILFLLIDIVTLGFGLILTWPLGMLWAGLAASARNRQVVTVVR